MNYEQAKELMIAHAPSLIIDSADAGQRHVDVRKALEERAAVAARAAVLDADGNEIEPAVAGSPHIEAKTSEAQKEEKDRETFLDALRYAEISLPDPKADVPPGPEKAE